MHRHKSGPTTQQHRPHLWLAAADGVRLDFQEEIAPIDAPEAVLEVEFVGLTEEEQRAALAGFPGGRRFRLKDAEPMAADARNSRPTRH